MKKKIQNPYPDNNCFFAEGKICTTATGIFSILPSDKYNNLINT